MVCPDVDLVAVAEKLVGDWTKQTRKVTRDLDKQRKQMVKNVEKTIAPGDANRSSTATWGGGFWPLAKLPWPKKSRGPRWTCRKRLSD